MHYPPPIHGSAIIGKIIKESKYINSKYDSRFINLSISYTINDIGKGKIVKILRYFTIICNTLKQLIFFRPDLCYMTPVSKGIGFYKDFIIILIVKIFNVRIIYHFHNKGICHRQNRFIDNLLYRYTFKNEQVILLSRLLYYDIEKYVSKENVYYCPNGIPELDEAYYSSSIAKKLGIRINSEINYNHDSGKKNEKKITNIVFLSNLIKSKGILMLIEACRILREKKIDFSCIIAGDEGDLTIKELKQEISEYKLSSYISVIGKIQGIEKIEMLKNADIFVFPSFYHNECMPLVLLEAMQHLLPIVTTAEGAIPDVVEDGVSGFIIPRQDVQTLAEKLEFLIQNPVERELMGEKGYNRFNKEFTIDVFENRLTFILEDVIRKNVAL
jgi:glycosyltransferase involved in cell wall biosynthesis